MRSLFRPGPAILLFSYLLLSIVPFFPMLLGKPVGDGWLIAATEAICWLVLWALFQHPRWFHYVLLPAMWAVPVEIYLRLYFGQGISTHHLGIMLETSPKEAAEFLGYKAWLLLLLAVSVTGWWWGLLQIARRHDVLRWTHGSRWLLLALFAAGAGVWTYGEYVGVQTQKPDAGIAASQQEDAHADNGAGKAASGHALSNPLVEQLRLAATRQIGPLPHWARIPYDDGLLARSWPFGLALRIADFWHERQYLHDLAEKSRAFRFNAHLQGDPNLPQTVLMVIGESSRFDRWQINGYDRETNPLLSLEENLVSFSDMVSAVSATRLSVPIIVSRKPAAQSLKAGFAEKSFLTAFKEAGFKTFWISNQMSFGQFDTPTSVFANEADVTQFLNLGGFTNNSNLDDVLLEPMSRALQDRAPKKLIVLHTLGNHWNYSHRHPGEYDHWKPSLYGIDNPAYTDLKNKEALNNSYDNSILYTDWILSELIQRLKASDQITSMMYVSDHGQTLYDGTCNLAFHGHNTQYEFHIPAFIWYSDAYQQLYPEKIKQLQLHRKSRLSTENVFHTLLDMGNVRYPDERLEWSILNRKWRAHTRYVDSYGWSNYDNASFRSDCREVIDRKTPLQQEK
ncbi:phosphoethanolamine transferase [Undibacterium oligocarboniphilum]|uniref:Phosphoethanolamine transferase n=1 Tax=Undibacterium oligocarboniphilum TaxID=666702 RepID=A0A850QN78_9BURK|nr:phosphoethanolamine transferase [Undibacterium oligocarboniphilum]MBC3871696.1 phosphoethanolamine transferase [Undibacterium oligocarboniphilum]NVO79115.1 phosphoethanolamine transferase [Undibacterium oligocarboniphilum]